MKTKILSINNNQIKNHFFDMNNKNIQNTEVASYDAIIGKVLKCTKNHILVEIHPLQTIYFQKFDRITIYNAQYKIQNIENNSFTAILLENCRDYKPAKNIKIQLNKIVINMRKIEDYIFPYAEIY